MEREEREEETGDAQALNPFELASFSREKLHYMALFDTEQWCDTLKGFTFDTVHMELSAKEGEALVHKYQAEVLVRRDVFSASDVDLVAALTQRLQECMNAFPPLASAGPDAHFFVRLSSRSPKDVGLTPDHPRSVEYLYEEVQKLGALPSTISPNDGLRAVQSASGRILKVRTAEEAIFLIVHSERTFSDLIHTLQHPEEWAMKIIVRRWHDGIDVETEFRGFVCQGELTALSQYNDGCFYPSLVGREQEIVDRILPFWNSMKHLITYPAAVVDFVLIDQPVPQVYCVEVNPFGPMTGASLFDWRFERHLLQNNVDLWGDLATCKRSRTNIRNEEAGDKGQLYKEFFSDREHGRPVLRIVCRPPDSATRGLLETISVWLAVVRYEEQQRQSQESDQAAEAKQKERCHVQ